MLMCVHDENFMKPLKFTLLHVICALVFPAPFGTVFEFALLAFAQLCNLLEEITKKNDD